MNAWQLPLRSDTRRDSRLAVIDRIGGCALRAERFRGSHRGRRASVRANQEGLRWPRSLLVDGPETARLPRRASGDADSPFVPFAATAGGLDRARCSSSPRCGLTIAPRASWLLIERSARCTARNSVPVGLFASALPTDELYAADAGRHADGLHAPLDAEWTP
jgi:hypothetical protein